MSSSSSSAVRTASTHCANRGSRRRRGYQKLAVVTRPSRLKARWLRRRLGRRRVMSGWDRRTIMTSTYSTYTSIYQQMGGCCQVLLLTCSRYNPFYVMTLTTMTVANVSVRPIEPWQVALALDGIKTHKATGPDCILNGLLKEFASWLGEPVCVNSSILCSCLASWPITSALTLIDCLMLWKKHQTETYVLFASFVQLQRLCLIAVH